MFFVPKRVSRFGVALGVTLLSCCALSPVMAVEAPLTPAFMPVPVHSQLSGETLSLTAMPRIVWSQKPSPLLSRAVARFGTRLAALGVPGRSDTAMHLTINVGHDPAYLTLDMREAYTLDVTAQGIVLRADGPAGVLHGLATLLQMIDTHGAIPVMQIGHIEDAPRFKWRGIMLDVSRHFMSTDTVKRQLDAMELTKLNVLHWHLSDGTGFRVESRTFPRLQEVGGHNQYYTQRQIREIVAYATDRGIRVVPEFDIPGHTLAVLTAYPHLAAQQPVPTTKDWQQDCSVASSNGVTTTKCTRALNLNAAALNPVSPQVLVFVRALFAEMARLFPDRYFHAGGDEVEPDQWTGNPEIAAYMKAHGYKDAPALQAAFTAQIGRMLVADGKIMMGWDEVSEAPIPKNVVVEAWRGSKWIGSATQAGHPVVVSSGYYLDLLNPSETHYQVDPFDTRADGLDPAEAAKARPTSGPMIDAFARDPNAPPLNAAQQALVLGGEAPLWSEVVSDEMVDARLWPRSAALAERYWSPASVRDVAALRHRLPLVQIMLERFGLKASENQARMIARLTPQNIAPLTLLTAITVPVRNYAINRLQLKMGEAILVSPAAIAAPDSVEAMAFNDLATRYAAGDTRLASALQHRLTRYAGNDQAFQSLATDPVLARIKPVSASVAALSLLGLEALQTQHHDRVWHDKAAALLAEQDRTYAASADHVASYRYDQPPGGLLIAIVPGIRALVGSTH